MISSYMDESFDPRQTGVFAVGGILGRGIPVFELERRWGRLRTRADIDIKYFKASECERGVGEFRKFVTDPQKITPQEREKLNCISKEFLNAIVYPPYDNNYLALSGIGVVLDDFYEVTKNKKARGVLGDNPYRLAYDFAMVQCAWAMKELGTGDCVAFVCDDNEQYSPFAYDAYRCLKDTNPNASRFMGSYSMRNDKLCEPLQAADAIVYEIRKVLKLHFKQWETELREQFGILTDSGAMYLIQHTSKEQLLHIVATHEPGEPYKLDELMELQVNENVKFRF